MIDPELEYQYNARSAVPEHGEIFARWKDRSDAFRKRHSGFATLQYGDGPRYSLDLFPGGGERLHMFLHGGYWQAMDKSYFSFVAEKLVERGVDVAICNYPLCPTVSLAGVLDAVRQACRYLWLNASRLQARWGAIQVSGHSAGGHLVSMLMTTRWRELDTMLPEGMIDSGISISGLYDLEPLRHTSINHKLGLDVSMARAQSPLYQSPTTKSPMLLVTGGDERPAFHAQMQRFEDLRRSQKLPTETLCLSGRNHFTVVEAMVDDTGPLVNKMLSMD